MGNSNTKPESVSNPYVYRVSGNTVYVRNFEDQYKIFNMNSPIPYFVSVFYNLDGELFSESEIDLSPENTDSFIYNIQGTHSNGIDEDAFKKFQYPLDSKYEYYLYAVVLKNVPKVSKLIQKFVISDKLLEKIRSNPDKKFSEILGKKNQ